MSHRVFSRLMQLFSGRRASSRRVVWIDALESRVVLSGALGQIMPLGDSITYGTTNVNDMAAGYRDYLYNNLNGAGYTFSFVGSQTAPATAVLTNSGNTRHEGWPGFVIQKTYNGQTSTQPGGISENISAWLNGWNPNYILLMIGTNDIFWNFQRSTAGDRLDNLITQITTLRPNANLIVAKITPITDSAIDPYVVTYNNSLSDVVNTHAQAGQHVSMVDMHTALTQDAGDPAYITGDHVHPTPAGYDVMADVWFDAINAIASGAPTLPATPTNVTASAVSSSGIDVSFNAVSGATGYNIYRSTTPGGEGSTPLNSTPITQTVYHDNSLLASTTYYYKVKAVNSAGLSSFSSETSATTQASGGGLTNVATGGTASGTGTTAANAFDGSTGSQWQVSSTSGYLQYQFAGTTAYAVTRYDITRTSIADRAPKNWTFAGSNDGTTFTTLDTRTTESFATLTTRPFTITNSTPYKYYKLSITATNGSSLTEVAELALMAGGGSQGVPAAPTGLTASASTGQVTLNWNTVSGATSYNVFRGTTAGGESATPVNGSPITATTFNDITVAASTTYYYTAKAVNAAGPSGASNEASATTPASGGGLSNVATGGTATGSGTTAAAAFDGLTNTAWQISSSSGYLQYQFGGTTAYAVTRYDITRTSISDRAPKSWTFAGSNDGTTFTTLDTRTSEAFGSLTTMSYTISNATPYRYYKLNIIANNGSSLTEVVELALMAGSGSPGVPSAPAGVSAAPVSSSGIDVSWNAVSGATGYNIYRGTTPGGEGSTPINSTPVTQTLYHDNSLSASTTYYYTVKAVNSAGPSGASSEVFATTQAAGGGLTNAASGGTASGTGTTAANAFDGNTSSAWQVGSTSGTLQYHFGGGSAYAVSQYVITRGLIADRAPKSWTFQASSDGVNWVTLDTKTDYAFGSNSSYAVSITNSTAHQYYRLNVTATAGSALLEIAELQLLA